MPQIRGVKGKAVVIYCEPLTTKEMGYHRLSRRVNNTVKNDCFLDITGSLIQYIANKCAQRYVLSGFTQISSCCLCNYEVNILLTNHKFISVLPLARRAYASERNKWPYLRWRLLKFTT